MVYEIGKIMRIQSMWWRSCVTSDGIKRHIQFCDVVPSFPRCSSKCPIIVPQQT